LARTSGRAIPEVVKSLARPVLFRNRKSLVMEKVDREYLQDYYREDIGKLSSLLDRDLRTWLAL